MVECTTNVGFRSNFGIFRQNEHSKIRLRLAIVSRFPFNPTYNLFLSFMGLAFYSPSGDQAIG